MNAPIMTSYRKVVRDLYQEGVYSKREMVRLAYKTLLLTALNWDYIKKRAINRNEKLGSDENLGLDTKSLQGCPPQ